MSAYAFCYLSDECFDDADGSAEREVTRTGWLVEYSFYRIDARRKPVGVSFCYASDQSVSESN